MKKAQDRAIRSKRLLAAMRYHRVIARFYERQLFSMRGNAFKGLAKVKAKFSRKLRNHRQWADAIHGAANASAHGGDGRSLP